MQAAFGLAASHTRWAYIRGGASPQRELRWNPLAAYPPVGAQDALNNLAIILAQQAAAAGATPAGLRLGRGGGRIGGGEVAAVESRRRLRPSR